MPNVMHYTQIHLIFLSLFSRYLQCADLSGGTAFELPQYLTTAYKEEYSALATQQSLCFGNSLLSSMDSTPYLPKASQADSNESHYLEITPSKVENLGQQNSFVADFLSPSLYLMDSACEKQGPPTKEQVAVHVPSTGQVDTDYKQYTQINHLKDGVSPLDAYENNGHKQGTQNGTEKDLVHLYERNGSLSSSTSDNNLRTSLCQSLTEQAVESLDASNNLISQSSSLMYDSTSDFQSQFTNQELTTDVKGNSTSFCHDGMVVAIDNSNIYIGAQECASTVNSGDRKRHVRVKLQNLVRILEKERTKTRGFACGSSPPATDHVWEVYR